ncbi:hypothetical protein DPMN_124894 [Dreissena polymorpha]|uniref:Uncharacterized protein n=1 Tax=Dreissena polymorpha TaxID=45954 RepID=A0A9D4GSY5_DREPO|nr:hypothetical protein DPMN_124862 [Dreissena polymorpha]KAH3823096.1 hypothetical protein DPMN_124894 [Dreissena polymorpha]
MPKRKVAARQMPPPETADQPDDGQHDWRNSRRSHIYILSKLKQFPSYLKTTLSLMT